jgi:hypothetical protein
MCHGIDFGDLLYPEAIAGRTMKQFKSQLYHKASSRATREGMSKEKASEVGQAAHSAAKDFFVTTLGST